MLEKQRKAAKTHSAIFTQLLAQIKPGMTLLQVNAIGEELIKKAGAVAINKGYEIKSAKIPFPAGFCLSVNDTIAHGIPTDYVLKEGDLLNIDFGIAIGGACADAAISIGIGGISIKNRKLLEAAEGTLMTGIEMVKAGVKILDISRAMEVYAKKRNYLTNKDLCGHGIGLNMHEDPYIPNFREYTRMWELLYNLPLKAGQVICLEPQLAEHNDRGDYDEVGWGLKTKNGKNSAYFEHMILVKEDGYEILTSHF